MQSPAASTRVGAIMGVLGALLIFMGFFLPFIKNGFDYAYEFKFWLVWIFDAVFMFGISLYGCFRKLPAWLIWISFGAIVIGMIFFLLALAFSWIFRCFDICVPITLGIGFWSMLVGLVLCGYAIQALRPRK